MRKRYKLWWLLVYLLLSAPLVAQDHLLITEFVVTPTAGEMIEIFNPTDQAVDLTNYYITDATFPGNPPAYYYNTVLGNGGGGGFGDFNARFPAGASIAPGEYQTLAMNGASFAGAYNVAPTYELYDTDTAVPDMLEATAGSINGQGGLTDAGEVIILYYWDGTSNLVKDVDYVVWGDKVEAVDKTGVTINGETYLDDTPIADQWVVNADNDGDETPHDSGMSAQRRLDVEDLEDWSGGNGITGHNETGENTSWKGGIWSINEPPTPGRRALSPYPAADSLTIADVQFVRAADIGPNANDDSPYDGDTLTVSGVVMVGMREIFLGARWGTFLQDVRGGPWSGFFVIQNDSTVAGTQLNAAQPGDLIRITGIMSEFPNGANLPSITQFVMITDPATPIEFVEFGLEQAPADTLTPGDLGLTSGGSSADPQLSERWEGVLAYFKDLTVISNGLPGNTMTAGDGTGTIVLDDYFNAVSNAVTNNGGVWPDLPPGTKVNVKGIVRGGTTSGFITINPRTLDDIEIAAAPPVVNNIARDPVAVPPATDVTVTATIVDNETMVGSAEVNYRVDGGAFQQVAMTGGLSGTFTGIIPGQAADAFIEYFITAQDDEGNATIAPGDTSASKFFYFVREGGLKVYDVQFSPFPDGNSGYANLEVTVTGVVTTDTSDFSFYWIQDGEGAWNGVHVDDNINQVKPGDEVRVTGMVREQFNETQIFNVSNVEILSEGNAVPAPAVVSTGDLATGSATAEGWEGVLVRVENVVVTNARPDGDPGFGEFTIDDGSGGVRVDDLSATYNGQTPSSVVPDSIDTYFVGDSIRSMTGIQYFSFSNYKIVPRNNADVDRVTTAVNDRGGVAYTYHLSQNYPNPFNPTTTINYSLAQRGQVEMVIYNMLGQKVMTLVDGIKPAGNYVVQWDGRNSLGQRVSTGVYFYKLKSGDFLKVQKMVMLK